MKIPQKILISIVYNKEIFNVEIPTELTIKEVKQKIVSSLNEFNREQGNSSVVPGAINLYFDGKELENEKLLVNYGIWDGSILVMR